jgi:hypothetical protein
MPDVPVTFLPRDKDVRKGYADAMRGNPPSKKVPMTGMASGRTDRGMQQGSAFKLPDVTPEGDYMGMAFDAAVRRGKDASRAYLLAKMKRDGRTDAFIQGKLKEFDDTIAKQTSLSKDKGLGEGMEKVYREAAQSNNQPTLAQAKQLRDARASVDSVKKLPSTIGNAIANTAKPVKRDSAGYMGEMGF